MSRTTTATTTEASVDCYNPEGSGVFAYASPKNARQPTSIYHPETPRTSTPSRSNTPLRPTTPKRSTSPNRWSTPIHHQHTIEKLDSRCADGSRSMSTLSGASQQSGNSFIGDRRILSENIIQKEIRVPKLRTYEETRERVIVVPETIRKEEIVDEVKTIREIIQEIEVPVYQEKIVEVPEFQYVEKIVDVPQIIFKEDIREVPRIEVQNHVTYKPKIVYKERIEEVEVIELLEVPVEKIVDIPEMREEVEVKEVRVDQYIDVPTPDYKTVEVIEEIHRNVPIPLQNVTTVEFMIPEIKAQYEKVAVPIYAPRFVEIPVPIEQMDEQIRATAEQLLEEISVIASHQYPSLCDIESVGLRVKNFTPNLYTDKTSITNSWQQAVSESLHSGKPAVTNTLGFGGNIQFVPDAIYNQGSVMFSKPEHFDSSQNIHREQSHASYQSHHSSQHQSN